MYAYAEILTGLLAQSGDQGPTAAFYGWEVFWFFYYRLLNYLRHCSWQAQLSLFVIFFCIIFMIIIYVLFTRRIVLQDRFKREYNAAYDRYAQAFREILSSPQKMSRDEMEYICNSDMSEIREFDSYVLTTLITNIRLEYKEQIYLPNLQRLCSHTGVQMELERNLIRGHRVAQTLQLLMTLPIRISDGALANYTSSSSKQTAELARTYYGFCSKSEPFYYVEKDIDLPCGLWYPTNFHRLCAWHKAKNHPIPSLLTLAQHCHDERKQALFISEIPFWGSDTEKKQIVEFLTSPKRQCRLATIEAMAKIGLPEYEQPLLEHYEEQYTTEKRAILQTILALNTGQQAEFLRQVYLATTSQNVRATALTCLYNYGEQGRQIFYELKNLGNMDSSRMFEQIISSNN